MLTKIIRGKYNKSLTCVRLSVEFLASMSGLCYNCCLNLFEVYPEEWYSHRNEDISMLSYTLFSSQTCFVRDNL